MLIQSGRVSALATLPWTGIELTSEARTDEVVLHLVRWAVKNLESKRIPFQLLYPIAMRTSDSITLLSPYLWMRTPYQRDLWGIGSIMGISDWLTDASGNPIPISDEFISTLIDRCREVSDSWSAGIETGSGVRVLLGSAHGLCGIVETIRNGDATIRVALRSRAIRLRIPVRALQRLTSEPKDYFEKEAD